METDDVGSGDAEPGFLGLFEAASIIAGLFLIGAFGYGVYITRESSSGNGPAGGRQGPSVFGSVEQNPLFLGSITETVEAEHSGPGVSSSRDVGTGTAVDVGGKEDASSHVELMSKV